MDFLGPGPDQSLDALQKECVDALQDPRKWGEDDGQDGARLRKVRANILKSLVPNPFREVLFELASRWKKKA